MPDTVPAFRVLLKRLRKNYPTIRAFAAALEIDPTHLSRAMSRRPQPFDVRGCLRLARVTGADPSLILRSAGKAEIADLIESLYGQAAAMRLAPDQAALVAAYDAIPDVSVRRSLLAIANAAAGRYDAAIVPPRRRAG